MTRKLNKDNGLQDWKTEHQAGILEQTPLPASNQLYLTCARKTTKLQSYQIVLRVMIKGKLTKC